MQSRLPTLTGMRFLAALFVSVYHVTTVTSFGDAQASADVQAVTAKLGFLGVTYFFVLSGFVLTWSARDTDTAGSFWRRRLCKVYPNHLVTFVLAVLVLLALARPLTGLVPNLLLVHAWVPDKAIFNSVNMVSWSLSCEAFFYLLFPLLYRILRRLADSFLWWAAAGVTVAVVLAPLLAGALFPTGPGDPTQAGANLDQVWFVFTFPPVALLQFVLGMLMARIVRSPHWIGFPLPVAAVLLAGGYALALVVPYNFGINATTVAPVALVVAAGATADVRGTRTFLRNRGAVWLGELSFAYYLVHYLVLLHGRELLGIGHDLGTGREIALLVAWLAVSLTLAWLLYAGVERPVMRRWSRPRRNRGGTDDPPTQPLPRIGHGNGGPVVVEPARPDRRSDGLAYPPRAGTPAFDPRGVPVVEQPGPHERRR